MIGTVQRPAALQAAGRGTIKPRFGIHAQLGCHTLGRTQRTRSFVKVVLPSTRLDGQPSPSTALNLNTIAMTSSSSHRNPAEVELVVEMAGKQARTLQSIRMQKETRLDHTNARGGRDQLPAARHRGSSTTAGSPMDDAWREVISSYPTSRSRKIEI